MAFVYLHIVWFASWIGFGVEKYPFGLLTMIVSLEAIFLSTVMLVALFALGVVKGRIARQAWLRAGIQVLLIG
jgi:hypothetical protein